MTNQPHPNPETFKQLLKRLGVSYRIRQADMSPPPWEEEDARTNRRWHYRVTLTRKGYKSYSFSFWDSVHAYQQGTRPTIEAICDCLIWNNPSTFAEFCNEFGYDDDSIKARDTWQCCTEQYTKLAALFNPSDIEQIQSTLEDR